MSKNNVCSTIKFYLKGECPFKEELFSEEECSFDGSLFRFKLSSCASSSNTQHLSTQHHLLTNTLPTTTIKMCSDLETTWTCGGVTQTKTYCQKYKKPKDGKVITMEECPDYKGYAQKKSGKCLKCDSCKNSKKKCEFGLDG